MYWDDKFNTRSVSNDVITNMRIRMTEDSNNASSSSFLLEDGFSVPLVVDDLFTSLQVEDFEGVEDIVDLEKCGAIHLKMGQKRIMFGHGIS
ncbi:hypothetical protein L2E82_29895 [Cichorium intybus]|uniref:Uncharacterized protein n=1 Tax=Cichorium intybus TaxID=13427 RepID=A0ACB9CYV6_CICIN|nr:hypothetical protein L2E82_29895 [Cichorium intybus]